MDEKIKEFAIRCNIETGSYEYGSRKEFDYEKFAELIVKECINICTKGDIEKPMGNYYAKQIEKHFGLKKYNKTIYDEISWRSDKDRE